MAQVSKVTEDSKKEKAYQVGDTVTWSSKDFSGKVGFAGEGIIESVVIDKTYGIGYWISKGDGGRAFVSDDEIIKQASKS